MDDEELDLIKEDEDESSSEGDETDGKKRFTMSKVCSTKKIFFLTIRNRSYTSGTNNSLTRRRHSFTPHLSLTI